MRPIALVTLVAASIASGQAPPNTTVALVGYSALKNRVKPTGELAAQIAAIDSVMRVANARGQTAEVRRQIAKGTSLLNNRPWTDADDYRQSLVLRSEHLFVDPADAYSVRLEQTYAPDIVLMGALKAKAMIRPATLATTAPSAVRTLAEFTDVGRDLRDAPLRMDLKLTDAPDGDYVIDVEVSDSTRTLGTARLRIAIVNKLNARLAALDNSATRVAKDVEPDVRYPADYVRKIDRGLINFGGFDIATELVNAELAANAKPAKAPRTGGFERHYVLDVAGEIMPYRLYVPTTYDGKKPFPLIIALHGLGGNEDTFMENYDRRLPQLAESRGYIVAAPLGYRIDGGYGSPIMDRGKKAEISEADVMQVLVLMKRDYKLDEKRIYLMGHSMGAIGTWHIEAKYPEIWAAAGSFSGMGFPASVVRMKAIPQFVVHGDNDNTVAVQRSRDMVAEMQKLGMDYKYIEVPNGTHNDVVSPNMAAMFDFFDARKKP